MTLFRFIVAVACLIVIAPTRASHAVYNADLGRWIQRDPAGFADGPNLYLALQQNPLNRLDATGFMSLVLAPVRCEKGPCGGFSNAVAYLVQADLVEQTSCGQPIIVQELDDKAICSGCEPPDRFVRFEDHVWEQIPFGGQGENGGWAENDLALQRYLEGQPIDPGDPRLAIDLWSSPSMSKTMGAETLTADIRVFCSNDPRHGLAVGVQSSTSRSDRPKVCR